MMSKIFTSGFKGRSVEKGQLVYCYRNLNNGLFSVMAADGPEKGKVLAHFQTVLLLPSDNGSMIKLSKAAQERSKASGVRNVHLMVKGVLEGVQEQYDGPLALRLTYNPFKHDTFVEAETGERWTGRCDRLYLSGTSCYVQGAKLCC